MEEFFHFWRDDFKFEDRELGCAIKCMSAHFNLLTDEHRMHHENTHKFIKSFPNGEIQLEVRCGSPFRVTAARPQHVSQV